MFQTPGRGGSQSSDSDSAVPGNAVDVNNEGSSEVPCTLRGAVASNLDTVSLIQGALE